MPLKKTQTPTVEKTKTLVGVCLYDTFRKDRSGGLTGRGATVVQSTNHDLETGSQRNEARKHKNTTPIAFFCFPASLSRPAPQWAGR